MLGMPRLRMRWKILCALLAIGTLPLLVSALLDRRELARLGADLAAQSGEALREQSSRSLNQIADNYARLVDRERRLVELLVKLQAREAEIHLTKAPDDAPVHWVDAFDARDPALKLTTLPTTHWHSGPNGEREVINVSTRFPVFVAAPELVRAELAVDAARLAAMTPFYRDTFARNNDIVYRQYVALDNGLLASFPGHGAFPSDFDPRERLWYREQKREPRLRWSIPHVDASSNRTFVNATTPIHNAAGEFVGVGRCRCLAARHFPTLEPARQSYGRQRSAHDLVRKSTRCPSQSCNHCARWRGRRAHELARTTTGRVFPSFGPQ